MPIKECSRHVEPVPLEWTVHPNSPFSNPPFTITFSAVSDSTQSGTLLGRNCGADVASVGFSTGVRQFVLAVETPSEREKLVQEVPLAKAIARIVRDRLPIMTETLTYAAQRFALAAAGEKTA